MNTILDYIKEYGKYSFREMPMTEADSLVFCQLSYLKFDGLVPGVRENQPSVLLESLKEHPDYENLFADTRYEPVNRPLIEGMMNSWRYKHLKLNCYVNFIDTQSESQFSAITFILDDGTVYIAFRGTDETIIGWKEDFNMSYTCPVPGHEYSVRYLNSVASRLHRDFYVGGHSKGGNLAVYSAMNCKPEFQDRIIRIYSMDGPGFRPEVTDRCNYDMIRSRVLKLIPHSSLIGMMFEFTGNYEVVESKGVGLGQHNPYTWIVEGDHLKRVNDVYEGRKKVDETINNWILSLSEEQLQTFFDTLYRVMAGSKSDNLIDLAADWKQSMNGMRETLKGLDEDTAKVVKEVIRILFEKAGEEVRQDLLNNTKNVIENTKDFVKQGRVKRTPPKE